jgi:uncharacterized protein YbjT (DUF2867 family)
MRILVTGASGFVGSRLIPRLLADEHDVRALARDPRRVIQSEAIEVVTGDIFTAAGIESALQEIEVAYYLIHSMERPPSDQNAAGGREAGRRAIPIPFPERERRSAERFAAAAAAAGVSRIVYLGGPTASWTPAGWTAASSHEPAQPGDSEDPAMSAHLRSRLAVERILREAVPDTVALRASIVIGARSRSFRFMVRLVERMRVLALPSWRTYRTRPIDARDVIDMLAAAGVLSHVAGQSLDIGGPEILTYGEMIERIAELMLLARPAVGVGVSATPITAPIAAAIAGEDPALVGALMESLQGDLLPDGPDGKSYLQAAKVLGVELHSYDSAVERALHEWEAVEPLAAR